MRCSSSTSLLIFSLNCLIGRGDAILFYSQRPDGELDENSLHGACPVLKGMKWGANLWVWNACRYSQCEDDPLNPAEELPDELKAPFVGGV